MEEEKKEERENLADSLCPFFSGILCPFSVDFECEYCPFML